MLQADAKGVTALLHAEHGKAYRLHLCNASGTVEASVLPASPAACFGTLRAELMLPARAARIKWKKQSLYDVYPLSHIDRPIGEACRLPAHAVPERYEKAPTWDWAQDTANFSCTNPASRTTARQRGISAAGATGSSGSQRKWKTDTPCKRLRSKAGSAQGSPAKKRATACAWCTAGATRISNGATTQAAPTCTESGNTAYYVCEACGKWFADADATQEITDQNSVIVPATDHTPAEHYYADPDGHALICETCGVTLESGAHVDEDGDGLCDVCAFEIPAEPEEPTEPEQPTDPEQPTQPEEPTEPTTGADDETPVKDAEIPKTGSAASIGFGALSLAAAGALVLLRVRSKKNDII